MCNFRVIGALCLLLQASLIMSYDESDLDATDLACIEELGYDKNTIISSYDENEFIKEGKPQMNKFYACAWKKDGLQNDDGSINASDLREMVEKKLKKLFPDHEKYRSYLAEKSTENCVDTKGNDNGDTCVKIYNCLLRKINELSEKTKVEDVRR